MPHSPVSHAELLQQGYRYAFSLTHHKEQAEDVLQEAWLAVMQANGDFSRAYLFSAIRSRYFNRHKREKLIKLVNIDDEHIAHLLPQTPDLEDLTAISDRHMQQALATLRTLERECLFLAVVEEYTAQEIADFTELSRGTVLSLLHRSKAKLKRVIDEQFPEYCHER